MSKESLASTSKETQNESNGNGLLLYQYYYSFYCQKVVFALVEKKLEFKSHLIDLGKAEQYQPWYLKLNPQAEVPVLKDGMKIIPDSSRIIDYIEDNFTNGSTPHLLPDKGTEQFIKVKKFDELLAGVSARDLTFGSMFFPELCTNSKVTAVERQFRKNMFSTIGDKLTELELQYPEFKEQYSEKRRTKSEVGSKVQNRENMDKALEKLEEVFDECEKELEMHIEEKSNWWLCCDSFSIADISLAVLLTRIEHLGLYERCFKKPLRPCLRNYYERIQQRDSYKEVMSQGSNKTLVKCKCCHSLAIGVGSVVVLGFIVGAVIVYKRLK